MIVNGGRYMALSKGNITLEVKQGHLVHISADEFNLDELSAFLLMALVKTIKYGGEDPKEYINFMIDELEEAQRNE